MKMAPTDAGLPSPKSRKSLSETPVLSIAAGHMPVDETSLAPDTDSRMGTKKANDAHHDALVAHVSEDGTNSDWETITSDTTFTQSTTEPPLCGPDSQSTGDFRKIETPPLGYGPREHERWVMEPTEVHNEEFYATDSAVMIDVYNGSQKKHALCIRLSHELSLRLQDQIKHRRSCARLQERCEEALRDIEGRIAPTKSKRDALTKNVKEFLKETEDRDITPSEREGAVELSRKSKEAGAALKELEAEKRAITKQINDRKADWQKHVLEVEKILEDVLVKCGLMIPEAEEIDTPNSSRTGAGAEGSAASHEVSHTVAADVKRQVTKHRNFVRGIQSKHDDHRKGFRRKLAVYVNDQTQRPSSPQPTLELEFSQKHLQEGRQVAQELEQAEAGFEAALLAAAAAGVSVLDSNDPREPYRPYDEEEFSAALTHIVDRDYISAWAQDIPFGEFNDLPPVGLEEAALEEEAMRDRRGTKRKRAEDDLEGDFDRDLNANTSHRVDSAFTAFDTRNAEILPSGSERAYGRRRRRIDLWTSKVRDGHY